jgi:nucleoside-diphosphate-sugar epimerase
MLLLCFGYGYVAKHMAVWAQARGWQLATTTRSGKGSTHAYADGEISPELRDALRQATHILISAPPHEGEANLLQAVADDARNCRWIGYLSSTGVYGDRAGGLVTELSAPMPINPLAEGRLQSEHLWRGLQAHSFRLAGIYGPGRSPFDAIREGRDQLVHKPGHVFNRIHVEDIVRALAASIQAPTPGEIFNLADDCPAAQETVMAYAYHLLGETPPKPIDFEQAIFSPTLRSFYEASRRVDASKIKRYHGINWKYPSYREGLAAILQEDYAHDTRARKTAS